MNFTDAVKEHDNGEDMFRKSNSKWIWSTDSCDLQFKSIEKITDHLFAQFQIDDIKATDWCVVEEKKPTLSDKVMEICYVDEDVPDKKIINLGCRIEDIQDFINEVTTKINVEMSGLQGVIDIIHNCAGGRFK